MTILFWKHYTTALVFLSALATLFSFLFELTFIRQFWYIGGFGLGVILLISFLYAWWWSRSKTEIKLNLSSNLDLTIFQGDIFAQKGVICIPFNEFFDTHVDNKVVSEKSLHGMFINEYFKDRPTELQEKIRNSLKNISPIGERKRRTKGCPKDIFPLGTCIDIRDGGNTYVLFALTHFDKNDNAYINRAEYAEVTRKLIDYLSQMASDKPVYIPLFGTGLSRMKRTPQRILYHLVNLLDFEDNKAIPKGLNIVIKSLSDMQINLTELEYLIKKGISKSD